jgi:hypothetical protein
MFLFGDKRGIPPLASSRIQRWALTLSAYNYTIRYRAGKNIGHADALSRLPQPVSHFDVSHFDVPPSADLLLLTQHLSSTSISANHIKQWTSRDPVLSCVRRFIQTGWPEEELQPEFRPYFSKRSELSVFDGCILRASRIVVPSPGRDQMLQELHETHSGVSKMKSLARAYIWWPDIDTQIEQLVKSCPVCQESRSSPPVAPLHPWEWPSQPWSRVHIDYFGPFQNHMFMVVVDAHSKWVEACVMSSITAAKTIEQLRVIFATHGLLRKVVTDNGPSFTSDEFRSFLSYNGITHVTSAPYHPSSNGLAERAVQTVKNGLRHTPGATLQEKLSRFLLTYRITPHTTTGVTPSQLLMGRCLRSRLDRLFPDVAGRVESRQTRQVQQHNNSHSLRTFKVTDTVYVRDFTSSSTKWLPGTVVKITGPLSYHVKLSTGETVRRHVDAIHPRYELSQPAQPQQVTDDSANDVFLPDLPPPPPTTASPRQLPPALLRRSTRHRTAPDRFGH